MAMTLSLLHHHHQQNTLTLIAGFENGYASVHQLCSSTGTWILTYRSQVHSQPILSLDVRPEIRSSNGNGNDSNSNGNGNNTYSFFTSGADALIAKHPVPMTKQEIAQPFDPSERIIDEIDSKTPHNPSLSLLSRSLHKDDNNNSNNNNDDDEAAAAAATSQKKNKPSPKQTTLLQEWKHAKKVINTRHSGQQSLKVRSDGSIFATAGWDSKIRVYSCQTMKELAVLKWHKDGAYAVTFSDVGPPSLIRGSSEAEDTEAQTKTQAQAQAQAQTQTDREIDVSRLSVTDRRNHRVRTAHWVAAGAKDGRVSLWDIY